MGSFLDPLIQILEVGVPFRNSTDHKEEDRNDVEHNHTSLPETKTRQGCVECHFDTTVPRLRQVLLRVHSRVPPRTGFRIPLNL